MHLYTRHSFYETDDKLTLEIFDKGVDPEQVKIEFQPRAVSLLYCNPSKCVCWASNKFTYENGETKKLVLQPLKGEIDPEASTYTIGKVKVEIKFAKRAAFRWGSLTGDSPDSMSNYAYIYSIYKVLIVLLLQFYPPSRHHLLLLSSHLRISRGLSTKTGKRSQLRSCHLRKRRIPRMTRMSLVIRPWMASSSNSLVMRMRTLSARWWRATTRAAGRP